MVIPKSTSYIPKLLQEYHDSAVGGHLGDLKTYFRMVADWDWLGTRKEVAQYVQKCAVCQQHKGSTQNPAWLLQPLPIPSQVRVDISMDFMECLPLFKGFDTILVVVDRLTKCAHFMCLKHRFSALTLASKFMAEVVRLHGFLVSIVTDRDHIFLSLFWREHLLQERDAILDDLEVNLIQAQQQMKQAEDGHCRDDKFDIGDIVYLKL